MKEWIKVTHTASDQTSVKVTVLEGNLSTSWAVKTFSSPASIKQGVIDARKGARTALAAIQEAA